MKLFKTTATVMALSMIATAALASRPPATLPGGWQLVWSDEFDKPGPPDPQNWTYETGFVRNEEAQWYQAANATCEHGALVIEGKRERIANPAYDPKSTDWKLMRAAADYSSASVTTRGLHAWQYGRFLMRARIDTRPGLWPAFWTLGTEGEWPQNGEVDIMEYYRGDLLANIAWGTEKRWTAKWNTSKHPLTGLGSADWSHRYHTWRMDWDADSIKLYVDDVLLNEQSLKDTVNPDGRNPFRQPHYMILNLAIGGTSGGDPSATQFPAKFEIDYVRVYQKPPSPAVSLVRRLKPAAVKAQSPPPWTPRAYCSTWLRY
jgi:beta-glucanase (GH16 family)